MPENNRIVFVANTSWSIYRFRLYVIRELISNGYNVFVLAPRDRYTASFEQIEGLTFVAIKNFDNNKIAPLKDFRLYKELQKHYKQIDPAIIFHYTIKANICGNLAAGKKFKSISVITGLGYAFLRGSFFQSLARSLYRNALKSANEVWFLNEDDKEIFLSQKLITSAQSFVLPGEGVDTDTFRPGPMHKSAANKFLLIARLTKHKGIYEFVDAIRSLKKRGLEVEGKILGKFDEDNPASITPRELRQWTSSGTVQYLGESDDVRSYIAACDCVVLPSYREGLPVSLLEAASMSKPLIAADTAGCRDVVSEGENGYLCKAQSAESLAKKLEQFYNLGIEEKRQMGIRSREKVMSHFRKEIVAEIYLDRIRKMML